MQPIPEPELLDPERTKSHDRDDMTTAEHRTRAQQLDKALHDSCAYATELWQHLDAARHYLYECLPSDPRAPGTTPHAGASPTGPDDEQGWKRWIDTYATVTSILAGPHGDSGFGLDEARHAARDRREAPNLTVLARAQHAGLTGSTNESSANARSENAGSGADGSGGNTSGLANFRLAGLGVLVVLALRGLRASAPRADVAARRRRPRRHPARPPRAARRDVPH